MLDDAITITEAAAIYRRITGKKIAKKYLEEQLHIFRHLSVFECVGRGSIPQLTGARRRKFEYFVKARMVLKGARYIFDTNNDNE